jgi:uncharacterized protein
VEACLFVDHLCNLACRYCYNGEHFSRPMSIETAKRAVDRALAASPPHLDVSFFGGEPLLRVSFIEEVALYTERCAKELGDRAPPIRFVMNTNATALDDAALDLMAPPRPFVVFVSLDGDRQTHDRNRVDARGAGSYDKVVAGIRRLAARKIPYELVAVVGVDSARELGRTVRALAELEPRRIVLSPNFRDAWTDEALLDLRAGLDDVAAFWIERFRAGEILRLDPLQTKILTHLHGGMPCPVRCLLGQSEWTVAPSGDLYPCAQMVGEDDKKDLVIGRVDLGFDTAKIAALQAQKNRVETTCAPCELRDRCQSHCGCRHLGLTGRLGEINAVLCETESAFIDAADHAAETLYAERCPAFVRYFYERQWTTQPGAVLSQLRRSRDA